MPTLNVSTFWPIREGSFQLNEMSKRTLTVSCFMAS
jgi:hypothetical protein